MSSGTTCGIWAPCAGHEVRAREHPGGAAVVFVDVTTEPRIPGQDVWPVVLDNMWRLEHAAAMCAALRGHATTLPRVPAAKASSNWPAGSLAILHCGSRAWCWVIAALETHSSALCLYDRGGVQGSRYARLT